jgi:hypothetical protein
MSHVNNGACEKCIEIIEKYPGFNDQLKSWFLMMQAKTVNFHCANAGRGEIEQESYFQKGASKAHWGQSSHNYNCAIDTFFMVDGAYSLDKELFAEIAPEIPDYISWYGAPDAKFYELPHFEIKEWRKLMAAGEVNLVE